MTSWYYFKLFFLLGYTGIGAYISYIVYKNEKKYYEPIYVNKKSKDGKEEVTVYLHDEFDVFTRRDTPINYLKLFFGMITTAWIKFILSIIMSCILSYKLHKRAKEKNNKFDKEDIEYMKQQTYFCTSLFLRFSGIFSIQKRLPDEKVLTVYKKYFGPDYKLQYDGKFCCYICNHTSFNDILLAMRYYGCGFISKESVSNVPVFGKIAIGLQSVFVNRENAKSRGDVLNKIIERQKKIYNEENVMPLMIFPEGTTTSGRHLLKFKKGAFVNLLPIKPLFIHPNLNNNFHLGCGSTNVGINYLRTLTELYVQTYYYELPIMTPNEYMYTNFAHFGKEKWEIYAEVAREIMCELGDFKKSDFSLKDSYRYDDCITKRIFIEREKMA